MAITTYGSAAPAPTGRALGPPRLPHELPKNTVLVGTLLVLVADAMVLAGLVAMWVAIKSGAPAWPPHGVSVGTYLPTTVTITAAMTAFSVQWVVSSVRRNDQRSATIAVILSVVLGIAIVNAQWYTLVRTGFGFNDHAYGTLFDLFIGYHLVNTAIAILALVAVGARTLAGHFSREGYDQVKAVAAIWQFANIAWAVIITFVFFFSAHG
ncbi:MAG: cytochrome c oxidase subunit 3 [Acidimicrobiales bacterium]